MPQPDRFWKKLAKVAASAIKLASITADHHIWTMSDAPSFLINEPEPDRFWKKLAKVAARIPFTSDLLAAWFCAVDPDTPPRVRMVLMGAIGYFVLPTDAVPDFIAAFGFMDDASVLAMAVSTVARHIQPAHKEKAAAALAELRQ